MKKIALIILTIVFITAVAQAQKPVDKIPYTLSDNFETGELFAWEPYPYQQDDGYDALYYARTTPTHNNSKFALARPVKANQTLELAHGFTKQINLWSTAATRLKVAVYFHSDRNAGTLELSLGSFEGKRYFYTVNNPEANKWIELDLAAADFKANGQPVPAGEHLQVVTIKGSYPVVYYLNTYTILIDDFSINGERQRQFEGKSPGSFNFDKFNISILNKHFIYGDNIALSTSPEGNIDLEKVTGTLVDGNGKILKDNISFTKKGTEWVNDAIYKIANADARGQWEIRLTGATAQGTEVKWALRFLMEGNRVNSYPRLFFSKDELQKRIASEQSPVAKRILGRAMQNNNFKSVNIDAIQEGGDNTFEALTGGQFSPGGAQSAGWNSRMTALGAVIREGSFRYAFTGDTASGQQAKKALLKLCSFSTWNNAWMQNHQFWTYWQVGDVVKNAGYGYDMLHDLLTDDERKYVRNAIMDKGLKNFHRDMVEMNRMPSNNTNHIAMMVAGYGVAAVAIYGEDPGNPYLEPYLSGLITKTKEFIDRTYYEDGGYNEPKSDYMNMASRAVVEFIAALDRNFGIDYYSNTSFKSFYKYIVHASHSSGRMQDYGDASGPDGEVAPLGNQLHSEWLVYKLGNPLLYNYVKPFWDAGNGGYFGYLWYRDNITPTTRESLPLSHVYDSHGMVIRSGWDDASTIIMTHTGPHSNHYHYDQGSIQIMTNGETLLTDPGRGEGGYYDLDYLVYNAQAIAHNVMIVDNDPESQTPADYDNGVAALRDWPKMTTAFAGKNADALETDLAIVYKNKLDTYTRTMLYTKSGPLFLLDHVKSKSPKGNTFSWLFHAAQNAGNKRSIAYTSPRLSIERPNARLTMDVISPDLASGTIRDKNEDNESFATLSSKPNVTETNFLAVLMPEAKPSGADYGQRPVSTRVEARGWLGARVTRAGASDLGMFRIAIDAEAAVEGFTTDAKRFTASFNNAGKLARAYFEGSNFSGNGLAVKSTVPVICSVSVSGSATDIEVQADTPSTMVISAAKQPAQVVLNGTATKAFKYDSKAKTITIRIDKGKTNFILQ